MIPITNEFVNIRGKSLRNTRRYTTSHTNDNVFVIPKNVLDSWHVYLKIANYFGMRFYPER